ncbi:RNase E G incomplete domain containing protein [Pandoravirus dulcis]|uniref:RNase E G incomplete domain containing protein n=1 Tax=Pandoravirus dulcis TaxID=1349409 RepID=S4VXZ9_9VIRU|nr:RNase E G incomplete domain containing protein [Pandoravirus dulcis]AGO82769.1 RNase E G incomplete domain containing protein [Pandoravirus dulcis]
MEDDYADNETARLCAAVHAAFDDDGASPPRAADAGDDDDVTPYGYAGYGNYYEALRTEEDDDDDDAGDSDSIIDDSVDADAVPDDIGDLLPVYDDSVGERAEHDAEGDTDPEDTYDLAFDAFYAASLVAPLGDEQDVVGLGQAVSYVAVDYAHADGDADDRDGIVNDDGDDDHVDDVDDGAAADDTDDGNVNDDDDAHDAITCSPDLGSHGGDPMADAAPLSRIVWPLNAHPFAAYVDDASDSTGDADEPWHDNATDDWSATHTNADGDGRVVAVTSGLCRGHDDTVSTAALAPENHSGDCAVDLGLPYDATAPPAETDASPVPSPDTDGTPTATIEADGSPADVPTADSGQEPDAIADEPAEQAGPQIDLPGDPLAIESATEAAGDDDQKAMAAFEPIAVSDPAPEPAVDVAAEDAEAVSSFEPITPPVEAPVAAIVERAPEPAPAAAETAGSWWSPWSWWSGKAAPVGTASAASDARLKAPGLVLTKADLDSVRLRPVAARGPRPSPAAEPSGVLGQLLGLFGGVANPDAAASAGGVDMSSPPSVRALVAAMEGAGRASE